ncbi:MAG: hypothetical protein MI807_15855 [Verrucomicrobiales bacterium]|nr:hypothetical protein [Verrucomicrobiales bacterium]
MPNRLFLFLTVAFLAVSCSESTPTSEPEAPGDEVAAPVEQKKEAPPAKPTFWSEVKLHEVIREANPGYTGNGQFQIDQRGQVQAIALDKCGVTDITPFKGMNLMALYLLECAVTDINVLADMPLVVLYLENTGVKDISALKGKTSLRKLYLSTTDVSDLSPIKGLGISELNLVSTQVSDLSPLAGMPLQMLWLTDSPVVDISPLATCPLVSLTLHRTKVTDLTPLAKTNLQRLHIGETNVTDLTPLSNLRLTRLVFDPDKITKGIDDVMMIPTITEIGTKFEDGANDLQHPAQFWQSRQ